VKGGACAALYHAGPALADRFEVVLDRLLDATQVAELVPSAVGALSSVGRNNEAALRRILDLAEPRPPRPKVHPAFSDWVYDEVMCDRAAAITGLAFFTKFPEEVVPVLVQALDHFEEFDPDWSYEGEHGRVCAALEAFGGEAAPAVPRIIRLVTDWNALPEGDGDWPKAIFALLAAIGPAAREALPILESIREKIHAADQDRSAPLDRDDPLDRAILKIRGAE
jgi:hypothetical protein